MANLALTNYGAVSGTAAGITVTGKTIDEVCVINVDCTSPIYFRLDGTTATVRGAANYPIVGVGASLTIKLDDPVDTVTVSVISSGTGYAGVVCAEAL